MDRVNVVVVGAGYAGITAARTLHRAGRDVLVLEAAERIGGRVLTEQHAGVPIDLGGMWLGAGHDRFATLADEADATTFPTPEHGDAVLVDGRRRQRYDAATSLPPIGAVASTLVVAVLWRLDRMARHVVLGNPSATPKAARLDATTVSSWLRSAAPLPATRRLIEVVLNEVLCADTGAVSMLALLTYVKSSGGVVPMISTQGGAQQSLFVGGADGPLRFAAAPLGDRIRTASPVTRIVQRRDEVIVETTDDAVTADRVIVAVPPALAGRIHYEPGLPAARDGLTQQMPMGAVWKIYGIYDEPFWRHDGLSGESVDLRSAISATFDTSPPSGPGVMCTLVGGTPARRLDQMSARERRSLVLEHFTTLFGPRARHPERYVEKSWNAEPFVRGGYGGYAAPGALSSLGHALARPVGRLHWAGTETAVEYQGYIEGAIRSGERAAAEVLGAIAPLRTTV